MVIKFMFSCNDNILYGRISTEDPLVKVDGMQWLAVWNLLSHKRYESYDTGWLCK